MTDDTNITYGKVVGLDFTDRGDGRIVIHVAVDETT